jgi:hypothetical protein
VSDEPKFGDPDWGRYIMKGQGGAPVGDPTRWGVELRTPLADPPAGLQNIITPTILALGTRDGYARSWSVIGSLTLPTSTWDATVNGQGIGVQLEFTMGVGQSQITQAILLLQQPYTPSLPYPPVPPTGLCITQHYTFGGPYISTFGVASGTSVEESRPFAIIGGLVGQSISVRAKYGGYFPPTAGYPCTGKIAMLATPYAAGEGL